MSIKLHVFPPSPRAFKVLATAAYLKLDYEVCPVDFTRGTHRTPEFTALNPNQRMPVLEDDGFVLWESNAILQYLAQKRPESGLLPQEPHQRALVNQWQFWDLAHWDPVCSTFVFERIAKKVLMGQEPDAAEIIKAEQRLARVAPILDAQLARHRFIVGDNVTVADFSLGAALNVSQSAGIPVDGYSNMSRWYEDLIELPGWRKSMAALPANAQ